MKIKFYNRESQSEEIEKVYGDKAVQWLYQSPLGRMVAPVVTSHSLSRFYGMIQDSSILSHYKVAPFIRKFNIPIEEYLPEKGLIHEPKNGIYGYSSFNSFFTRKFREGIRSFPEEAGRMGAFAEARYFGYENLSDEERVPVKGQFLNAKSVLVRDEYVKLFDDGPMLLARLCPVDYHRFHFPDDGKVIASYRIHGHLESVNPMALKQKDEIFCENERHVTILETKNFGLLAYVEVGATMVGKIIQSYKGKNFKRGQEKGMFLFGASTVMVYGQSGKWRPSQDILEKSSKGQEVLIKLGDTVGEA